MTRPTRVRGSSVGFVAFAGPAALVVLLLGSLAGYLTRRVMS